MEMTYQAPSRLDAIRKRYFSTRGNTVATLAFAVFILWVLWGVLNWAVLDAVFGADNRALCLDG